MHRAVHAASSLVIPTRRVLARGSVFRRRRRTAGSSTRFAHLGM